MTAILTPTVQDDLNLANPNRLASAAQAAQLGDLLSWLVTQQAPTEAGLVVAANVGTLAASASKVLDVVATVGGSVGRKALLIDSSGDVVPQAGQVVWDGADGLTFASADAITAADVWYLGATPAEISLLGRKIGQRDE